MYVKKTEKYYDILTSICSKEVELSVTHMHGVSTKLPVVELMVVPITKVTRVALVPPITVVTRVPIIPIVIWVVSCSCSYQGKEKKAQGLHGKAEVGKPGRLPCFAVRLFPKVTEEIELDLVVI